MMKLPYFKLGDAINDMKNEFSYGDLLDKAGSVAKLAGKTVANVGLLAVDAGVYIVKNAPEHMGKNAEKTLKHNDDISAEQRSKLEEVAEWGRKSKIEREEKEAKKEKEEKSKNNRVR